MRVIAGSHVSSSVVSFLAARLIYEVTAVDSIGRVSGTKREPSSNNVCDLTDMVLYTVEYPQHKYLITVFLVFTELRIMPQFERPTST